MKQTKNTGHLLSVYCPNCKKTTDKISFNLLREAGKVKAHCPDCQRLTYIDYDGKTATLYHQDDSFDYVMEKIGKKGRKDFKEFIDGKKR